MLDFWIQLRNDLLNAGFYDTGEGMDREVYVHIPSPLGAPESEHVYEKTSFNRASGSSIKINPVMFVVGANTRIDKLIIAKDPSARSVLAVITLEGDEIKNFETQGTFTINNLSIDLY